MFLKYVVILVLVVSCASNKHSSNPNFMGSQDYQNRPALEESFFKKSPDNFTEEQIQKLLSSKISKKTHIKLAVLEITPGQMSKKDETNLILLLSEIPKIKDVSYVPTFLMQNKYSLANMRDAAALLQADYLLVVKDDSDYNFQYQVLKSSEAVATTQMEVALIDVLSGAIPFTSRITGKSKTRYNEKEDFNYAEFRAKAIKTSEDEAYKSLTADLIKFWKVSGL